jgi:hypothetical protein
MKPKSLIAKLEAAKSRLDFWSDRDFQTYAPNVAIDRCIAIVRQWAQEPETVEAMARDIYTKRNGKWDYNAYRSDPRIAEAYREDAKAALAVLGGHV